MNLKKPLLIGILDAKTITGVALAFHIIVLELKKRNLPFRIVNLGSSQQSNKVGSFSITRSLQVVIVVCKAWMMIPISSTIYLTVGISLLGFFRDALIMLPAILLRKNTIIHVNSGGYGEFYNNQSSLIQKTIKWVLSKVSKIILLSDLLKDQFYFLRDESKFVIIPNTVDPSLLDSEYGPKHHNNTEPIKLLYLSNLMLDKGYLKLLEACRLLKDHGIVQFECYFCGDFILTTSDTSPQIMSVKQLKESFLNTIETYQLNQQVKYVGVVSGDEKKRYLRDSHLFILPTRYPWEGQPLSILEAMVNGLPVISTNYRAIPDQIQDGVTGFLLKTHDPAEIAYRVEELMANPQKYREMSRQSIQKFWDEFSPDRHMEKMVRLLYGM